MSGLCMGIKLRERGIEDFLILEKSPDVGGTWHDNRYPGACCDVPSVLYSYSFAPNPDWSRKFSPQDEIKAYFERCAERFGLLPQLRLDHRGARGLGGRRGPLAGDAGRRRGARARSLVSALGQLNVPNIPGFSGSRTLRRASFHSARWDHDCDLAGKRVAVIGNAASALQFIPRIAKQAERFTSTSAAPTTSSSAATAPYGTGRSGCSAPALHAEAAAARWSTCAASGCSIRCCATTRAGCCGSGKRWCRDYREEEISRPGSARAADPGLPPRLQAHPHLRRLLQRLRGDTVELVTSPITAIDAQGVETEDGVERPVDVMIYATGFRTSAMHSAVDFRGVGGLSLQEAWADGAEAYRGVCMHGFPNFFMLYGPNTNLGSNSIIFMVERQVAYAVDCIDKLLKHTPARPGGQRCRTRAYNERMQGELAQTVWVASCESWYKNAAGKVVNNWPRSTARLLVAHAQPGFRRLRHACLRPVSQLPALLPGGREQSRSRSWRAAARLLADCRGSRDRCRDRAARGGFAAALPGLSWQPTEHPRPSPCCEPRCAAAGLPNLRPPSPWISPRPWAVPGPTRCTRRTRCTSWRGDRRGLVRGLRRGAPGGRLLVYGPSITTALTPPNPTRASTSG
jgi:cation diffusion facilitator CzcD-associated flavoprotein CzcO